MSTGSAEQLRAVSPQWQRGARPSGRAARLSVWALWLWVVGALRRVLMRSAAGRRVLRRWSRAGERKRLSRETTRLVATRVALAREPARPGPGTTPTRSQQPEPASPRGCSPMAGPPQATTDSTAPTLVDARLAAPGPDNEPSLPWEEVAPEPEPGPSYGAWHDTDPNLPSAPHSASLPLEELLRLPALQVAGDLTLRQRLFATACEASRNQADLVRRILGSRLSGVQVASAPIRWDQNDFFRDLLERCAREGVNHLGQQAVLSRGRISVRTEEELTEVLSRLDRQLRGRILRRKVSYDGESMRHRLRVLDPLTGTVHEWQVCRRSPGTRQGATAAAH
jgi:hypothetical protein